MLMKRIFTIAIALTLLLPLFGEVVIVKKGKPAGRILCLEDNSVTKDAAGLLQRFVHEVSGAFIPVIYDNNGKPVRGDVVIGGTCDAGEDGFRIVTQDGVLYIMSGGDKGVIHGVARLLEDYVGVHYYATRFYKIDEHRKNIVLPEIDRMVTPAFRYRQTQSYAFEDPVFKMWFGWEQPQEIFIGNMWVHTFNRILPSRRFGKEHPEYYALLNGERMPGDHSQWCLSNPDVFEACCRQLDSIFAANPGLDMISVSQNDGNDTYCHCDKCMKIYEEEGAISGAYIRFMNKLAERYPDKQFSTLAYLFTYQPPKKVKPLPNVNIMLCDIDCKREATLTDNESGQLFVEAMKGWSEISDNIFVWDYGINFDNQVSPFPNFHIMQPNIQLFKQNNTTMHFSQNNAIRGTDFAEMRTYMLANLMWNPYCDLDSVKRVFMEAFYGAAAPYIKEYQDMMEGALIASHKQLWIYDSPITHKDGFLCPALIKIYDQLFDKALEAVRNDSALTAHVRMSRLPLMYSKLEIARTSAETPADISEQLRLFEQWTKQYNVQYLNERANTPADYCALYRRRYMPAEVLSKALGAKIIYLDVPGLKVKGAYDVSPLGAPDKGYQPIAYAGALTDGLYGGTTFVESWVGWLGRDADFIVDLGRDTSFSRIEIDFLHQLGAWIMLPKGGTYQIATEADGMGNWKDFGSYTFAEDRDMQVKFVLGKAETPEPVHARYIKVHIDGLGFCPDWHYGVGYAGWFFLDEINVY